MVVGEDGTNGGLWCSPVANTSSPTSSAFCAMRRIARMRSVSVGVRPVVGSVVTSPTLKIPNCMATPSVGLRFQLLKLSSYIFPGSTTFNYLNHGGARFVPEAAGRVLMWGNGRFPEVVGFVAIAAAAMATASLAPQRPRPRGREACTGGISQAVSAATPAAMKGVWLKEPVSQFFLLPRQLAS